VLQAEQKRRGKGGAAFGGYLYIGYYSRGDEKR